MSTNSDRHAAQLFVESRIGCASSEQLSELVPQFESYQISHLDLSEFQAALQSDARAYFKKALITILQAIAGLDQGHESWAMIKLYYATYFLLREDLAREGIAILRCRNIYTLETRQGEKPHRRSGNRYRGDHISTTNIHKDHFSGRDVLNSQSIDGVSPYDWLRDKREWINYRRKDFIDGVGDQGLSQFSLSYETQIRRFCADDVPIYCFDPDSATLALPIKRMQISFASRADARAILEECCADLATMMERSVSCRAFVQAL